MLNQMWSVQFWHDSSMVGFNKHWGTKRQALAFAKRCKQRDRAIAHTTIKIEPILQTDPKQRTTTTRH